MAMNRPGSAGRPAATYGRVPRRPVGWTLLCLMAALVLWGCRTHAEPGAPDARRLRRPMMGTLVEVVWRSAGGEDDTGEVRAVLERMERLASRMGPRGPESEVARINAAAGAAPVVVSREVLEVVRKAEEVSRLTAGAFDITVAPVEAAWGDIQWEGGGHVAGEESIRASLERVGYRRVRVDEKARTVGMERPGMRLDLGGIAKGFIVDEGIRHLAEAGIREVLVNAGGDIRASGGREQAPWRIGLRDPFRKGELLGIFRVREGAVVTSGTYERYLETREGRFGHIVDPATGRPAAGLVSATVLAEEAAFADALATALIVMGREKGIALLRRLPSVRSVLVEPDGTVWVDERLRAVLRMSALPKEMNVRYFEAG